MKLKRLVRFRLATLLVLLTVTCVWLGNRVNRARYEKAALKACRDTGALVFFNHQKTQEVWGPSWDLDKEAPTPRWLVNIFGESFFRRLAGVAFVGKPISDSELQSLSKLTALHDVSLQGQTHIGDTAVPQITKLSQLENLCLWDTAITDQGLAGLTELGALKGLGLSRTCISDRGLSNLAAFRNLTLLELDGTAVTDEGLPHLYGMQSLSTLNLCETDVTREGVDKLRKALPNCEIGVEREKYSSSE